MIKEKVKYSGSNLSLCYFVHHMSNIRQVWLQTEAPAVSVRRIVTSAMTRPREFLGYY